MGDWSSVGSLWSDQTNHSPISRVSRAPGTYVLILRVSRPSVIRTPRPGYWKARPGFYLYVGSALGPGGVRARVSHHLRPSARFHWHVDYLTVSSTIEEVWYSLETVHREHQWVAVIAQLRDAVIPCPTFGASDCRCASHLYLLPKRPSVRSFRRLLKASCPEHPAVRCLRPGCGAS